MRLKLNESIQEAVSLRAHEKEAQLVALQSQLNPHFIHNMLQTIGIMAEEGSPAAIQELILNLARMLRYVSSTEATTATLGTEIEYAESYLAAMRARFGESLEYVIDVRPEMRQIVVPRLILQPFIENCFKYGTTARPPWRIELRGALRRTVGGRSRSSTTGRDSRPRPLRASPSGWPPAAGGQRPVPDVDLGDGNRQFLRAAQARLRETAASRSPTVPTAAPAS